MNNNNPCKYYPNCINSSCKFFPCNTLMSTKVIPYNIINRVNVDISLIAIMEISAGILILHVTQVSNVIEMDVYISIRVIKRK